MRIEALALFLSVAQHRSISHAARQHYISQQGASAMIKSLEQELEVTLFHRTPAGLQLTDAGRAIAKEATEVLGAYRRVQIAAALGADHPGDEPLTIVTMPFITNRLEVLFSEYESLANGPHLRIVERSLFDIVDSFEADRTGALFLIALPTFMKNMSRRVQSHFKPLVSCELMMVCARSHPLAALDYITPDQLCDVPLACYNEEFLGRLLGHVAHGRYLDVHLSTSNLAMIGRAVSSGDMVTFTDSLSVFLDRPDPDTVVVPIHDGVSFNVGILGNPEPGTAAARFAHFFERYLATSCASYLARHLADGAVGEGAEDAASAGSGAPAGGVAPAEDARSASAAASQGRSATAAAAPRRTTSQEHSA